MTLDALAPGRRGRITAVGGDGPALQRLLEMGFVEGVEIEVLRVAPLGDPIEVRVTGYLVSLRRAEASTIAVEAS